MLLGHAPDSPKVQVNGEIIRCDPEKIGIKFTGIDPESLFSSAQYPSL